MIKANDKDAKDAYFQGKAVYYAYFRGKKIWEHNHTWNSGSCSKCGKVCNHEYSGGSGTATTGACNICGMTHTHVYETGQCTICNYFHYPHTYNTDVGNGVCITCGKECTHGYNNITYLLALCANKDGICTDCGYKHTHTWDTLIGHCSVCNYYCDHEDGSSSNTCSICGILKATRLILLPATDNKAYTVKLNGTQYNVTSSNVIATAQTGENTFQIVESNTGWRFNGRTCKISKVSETGSMGSVDNPFTITLAQNETVTFKPSIA